LALLAILQGETDRAHGLAPAVRIERTGRGEGDVAGVAGARNHAPAVARALFHHVVGMGDAGRIAFLALHAHQGALVVAEFLQSDFANAQAAGRGPQVVEMDVALLGAHLDGDAAFEVDAEIEAERDDADDRQNVDRRRGDQRDAALAHEVEGRAARNEVMRSPQHGGLRSAVRSAAASAPRSRGSCG
jgi:hypothetical protein